MSVPFASVSQLKLTLSDQSSVFRMHSLRIQHPPKVMDVDIGTTKCPRRIASLLASSELSGTP